MPEGFHPTRDDMTMRVRREDVPAEVVAYVDNLERQLDAIVARCGIASFRAAMKIPDAERHEKLEAVMDLADLDRYAALITRYKTAVKERKVPSSDRRDAAMWMGAENVFGPEKVAATFGLGLGSMEIPHIPFSRADLERAVELDQFLVFRVNKAADGTPLSMEKMAEILSPRFVAGGNEAVLNVMDWVKNEPAVMDEVPTAGWALVSREVVPGTVNKNFLRQTDELVRYICQDVFRDVELPEKYIDAIVQFEMAKPGIRAVINLDDEKVARIFEGLEITSLFRPSPAEAAYDTLLTYDTTGVRRLSEMQTWTSRRSVSGRSFVFLGHFDPSGLRVDLLSPSSPRIDLGAVFSRR